MNNPAHYFLASLSHELRTPLNGIVGYSQLLANTELNSTQQEYVRSLNKSCLNLVELINDILDYSQLSVNKMEVHEECFSIREVISQVENTLNYKILAKNQTCAFVVEKEVPQYIVTDKKKLTQILINLLSNANKYTQSGGRIILRIEYRGGNIIISVEDNGKGIEKKHISRIFEEFYRTDDNSIEEGYGLGLSICKKLSHLLNGDITIQSEKGKGSTFILTFRPNTYIQRKSVLYKKARLLKNKHIIIIESDIDQRLALGDIIRDHKVQLTLCSSGVEALYLFRHSRNRYDLIIMNSSLEDISGTSLYESLKRVCPDIPCICVSKKSLPENNKFTHIIQEPVDPLKLLELVVETVSKNSIQAYALQSDDNQDCEKEDEEDEKVHNSNEKNATLNKKTYRRKHTKILIAEDNKINTDVMVEFLTHYGYYNVTSVENGKLAIEEIERCKNTDPYEILLLDLKMPIMGGIAVCEYLQKKKYTDIKVVVITASIIKEDRTICKQLGVKYFLIKPMQGKQLNLVLKYLTYPSL